MRTAALVAARFLKSSPEVFGVLVPSLEKTLRATTEPEERRATAAIALGELTVTTSVPLLLATVESADVPVKTAAIAALRHVTLQDFGDEVAKWDRWWAKNGDRDRAECLMDALTHAAPDIRAQAIRELSPVLPFDVSKFESLSEAGRVALQDRCRAWWKGDRSDRPGPLDRDGRA